MPSPIIDEAWHELILNTEEYAKMGSALIGGYLHHRVNSRYTPVPESAIARTMQKYKARFGEMPDIWFEDMAPQMRDFVAGKRSELPLDVRWSGWPGL